MNDGLELRTVAADAEHWPSDREMRSMARNISVGFRKFCARHGMDPNRSGHSMRDQIHSQSIAGKARKHRREREEYGSDD